MGAECRRDNQCVSGSCRGQPGRIDGNPIPMACRGPRKENGESCTYRGDCISNVCNLHTQTCEDECNPFVTVSGTQDGCEGDNVCVVSALDGHYCRPKFQVGEQCEFDRQCDTELCVPFDGIRTCSHSRAPTKAPTFHPTESTLPEITITRPGYTTRSSVDKQYIGTFDHAAECAQEALSNEVCNGFEIVHHGERGWCYCATNMPESCPADDSRYFVTSSPSQVYEYRACEGPTPSPTTSAPTLHPTTSQQRFDMVELRNGRLLSSRRFDLGRGFASAEACANAALQNSNCGGKVIEYDNPDYRCYCARRCTTEDDYQSSFKILYQYGECDQPAPVPAPEPVPVPAPGGSSTTNDSTPDWRSSPNTCEGNNIIQQCKIREYRGNSNEQEWEQHCLDIAQNNNMMGVEIARQIYYYRYCYFYVEQNIDCASFNLDGYYACRSPGVHYGFHSYYSATDRCMADTCPTGPITPGSAAAFASGTCHYNANYQPSC